MRKNLGSELYRSSGYYTSKYFNEVPLHDSGTGEAERILLTTVYTTCIAIAIDIIYGPPIVYM